MPHIAPDFTACLSGFDTAELEAMENVVYGIDSDWRLGYFNPAWQRFARQNGGEPAISRDWNLGRSILDALPADLQPFYKNGYRDCRNCGKPWHHAFECSSPSTYRRYQQTVYPLPGQQGLLIVNALVGERPHDTRDATPPADALGVYADGNDIVHQCCHCRRIKSPLSSSRWDWVPALVETPAPRTSHTLCAACLDFYYPEEVHVPSGPSTGDPS